MEKFKLPVGLEYAGQRVTRITPAVTRGIAEKVFKENHGSDETHQWFGKVLSVAIAEIAGEAVSAPFIDAYKKDKTFIPDAVKAISYLDAGSLLIQIQRYAWEDVIKDRTIVCTHCGQQSIVDVDLKKIEVPEQDGEIPTEVIIDLGATYETKSEKKEHQGYKYNRAKLRVVTLGDAIKHDQHHIDETLFWRKVGRDCLIGLFYAEEGTDEIIEVPNAYIFERGTRLLEEDWTSKSLKKFKDGLFELPSANFYYEDKCPYCKKKTPFFTSLGSFFS